MKAAVRASVRRRSCAGSSSLTAAWPVIPCAPGVTTPETSPFYNEFAELSNEYHGPIAKLIEDLRARDDRSYRLTGHGEPVATLGQEPQELRTSFRPLASDHELVPRTFTGRRSAGPPGSAGPTSAP